MGLKLLWLALLFTLLDRRKLSSCRFVSRISARKDLAEDGPLMTWLMGSLGDLEVSIGESSLKKCFFFFFKKKVLVSQYLL